MKVVKLGLGSLLVSLSMLVMFLAIGQVRTDSDTAEAAAGHTFTRNELVLGGNCVVGVFAWDGSGAKVIAVARLQKRTPTGFTTVQTVERPLPRKTEILSIGWATSESAIYRQTLMLYKAKGAGGTIKGRLVLSGLSPQLACFPEEPPCDENNPGC